MRDARDFLALIEEHVTDAAGPVRRTMERDPGTRPVPLVSASQARRRTALVGVSLWVSGLGFGAWLALEFLR
jgi:hypothetical protein